MRGADKNGPTAVIRSVLEGGFRRLLRAGFKPEVFLGHPRSPESRESSRFTNAFFKKRRNHIQYNITDTESFGRKVRPQEHRDLIVRIGGFSAYFVQLSPEIQEDVITRSEQML
jgi:formate C-acetyltransferase